MPDKQPAISSYSPAELMQYATGRMPAAEMHTLEKAALEDPFLAEALEGYIEALATQPAAMVQAQAERLEHASSKQATRVVPLWQRKIFRVAVAALFISGAGWSIFSLLQQPATPAKDIAEQAPLPQHQTDTVATMTPLAATDANTESSDSSTLSLNLVDKNRETAKPIAPATVPPPGNVAAQQMSQPAEDFRASAAPYSLQRTPQKAQIDTASPASSTADIAMLEKKEKVAMRSIGAATIHVFKGQITDIRSNPVPYANVMLEGQDFGTYSDVLGHFNFISEDSVLRIQVRSIGYNNKTLTLQNNRPETQIVLQEDLQLNNSLPLTVQKSNHSTVNLQKSIVERDSIVGLGLANVNVPFYDIYLLNNNRISPLPTLNRQVQLSFDVSKSGEATNITVIKSSGGKALDNEAIRLIKEGPKLNGDSTNSRRKVTVSF